MDTNNNFKIFLVDDDIFCLNFYRQHLINLGYQDITSFENGSGCLDGLTGLPDIIFLDHGTEDEKIILSNTYISINTFGNVVIATLLGFIGDAFGTVSIFIIMAFIVLVAIISNKILKSQKVRNS